MLKRRTDRPERSIDPDYSYPYRWARWKFTGDPLEPRERERLAAYREAGLAEDLADSPAEAWDFLRLAAIDAEFDGR